MVWRLHHGKFAVLQKQANRGLQERSRRNVITIENRNQFSVRMRQCRIDISCFGMQVVGTRQIVHFQRGSKLPKLLASPIIKKVDLDLVSRPVHGECRNHRRHNNREWFVVGRNKDIYRRPLGQVLWHRHGLALQRPGCLEKADNQNDPGIQLGRQQAQAQHQVNTLFDLQTGNAAPIQVTRRCQHGKTDKHQGHQRSNVATHVQGD